MSDLEQAAICYVAARLANQDAEPSDWMASVALVDQTWHELLVASGLMDEIAS